MNIADRIRAKFALALGRAQPLRACPPVDDIVAWHEESLAAGQAAQVQAHVAHCDNCFALWSGLVDLTPAPETIREGSSNTLRWWQWGVPTMALGVTAVAIWLGLFAASPIVDYELDVRGAMQLRGGSETTLTLRDDALLEIVLLPATAVDDTMDAALYAQTGRSLVPLPASFELTDKGVVSVAGVVGSDLVIPAGTTHLVVVVGRRDRLPSTGALRRALGDSDTASERYWRAWLVAVAR